MNVPTKYQLIEDSSYLIRIQEILIFIIKKGH